MADTDTSPGGAMSQPTPTPDPLGVLVLALDHSGRILHWGGHGAEELAVTSAAAVGRRLEDVLTDPELGGRILADLRTEGRWEGMLEIRSVGGHDHPAVLLELERVGSGELSVGVGVTTARVAEAATLRHRALHDPLTGLGNRVLLADRLERAIARLERRDGVIALFFVDLDEFKVVNDVHGHLVGDAVLVEVARRMVETVRPEDTVARYGGDEFVVVCELQDEHEAHELARRLSAALPRDGSGAMEPAVTVTVGVAIACEPGLDAESLLASADGAVVRAKRSRRG